ncbi:SubName: Full=Related to protein involved in cell growth {ECO:0000313/EMBL:CCA66718.1} [Serendipita indica DSM 11827]|nr:SubName: Full=Related to protein involved in cell growth {ECO:0000313/EMBL:CCA66718.1} [Serendipita indica DSM 11827]
MVNAALSIQVRYLECPKLKTSIDAFGLRDASWLRFSVSPNANANGNTHLRACSVETPERYHIPFEHIELITKDNVTLKSFLFIQKRRLEDATDIRTTATTDTEFAARRPTVIVFHGNAESYADGVVFARVLYLRLRCNVALASYRGYGDCTGVPSEHGIQIDSQILYGLSLGGAVAIDLASRNPETIHGVAIENTFLSLPKMLPVLMPALKSFKWLVKDKWRSEVNITKIPSTTPMLFLSGAKDEIVPPAHMQQLYDIAISDFPDADDPKAAVRVGSRRKFARFENGRHNDTWTQPEYRKALREFIDTVVVAFREK